MNEVVQLISGIAWPAVVLFAVWILTKKDKPVKVQLVTLEHAKVLTVDGDLYLAMATGGPKRANDIVPGDVITAKMRGEDVNTTIVQVKRIVGEAHA